MNPDRWESAKRLFHEALERPPAERDRFVREATAGDAALREEVTALLSAQTRADAAFADVARSQSAHALPLASHDRASSFLETPADAPRVATPADDLVSRDVGNYRVMSRIGAGGMGTVYLALRADDQYEKKVAIKVVSPGMDSEVILRRFRSERRILAALDHSNIARLLDGGTTDDGRPYVVIDYVEGQPIDEYCRAHASSIPERLTIFLAVCDAVHYAHQHLVVHRDLKPRNILVTPDGTPKLLDFGIAKLLESSDGSVPDLTVTEQRVMTPEYASPEQMRGEPIGTASDVYSLGVVLYELLTARRPYRLKTHAPGELARAIGEQDPARPSTTSDLGGDAGATVRRGLKGDLDDIVLKALRKEPEQRYGSVDQLAGDLRRHLNGLPVMASAGTIRYLCGKFVRRHTAAVAAAAIVVVTLLAGIAITSWEARRARIQQERADRRFNDVRRLANAVLFPLHDAIRPLPGSTSARKLLVEEALEYLDSLALESAGDPSLQLELAEAYERVGEIQGNVFEANVGESGLAVASYRKAVEICQALMVANPDDDKARSRFVRAAVSLSRTMWGAGDSANAPVYAERAREVAEGELAKRPGDLHWRDTLASALFTVGFLQAQTGDTSAGAANLLRAAGLYETLSAEHPGVRGYQAGLGATLVNAGTALERSGRFDEARDQLRRAVAVQEALAKAHPDADGRRRLLIAYGELGTSLKDVDPRAALDYCRREVQLGESLMAADPSNAQARRDLGNSLVAISELLMKTGDVRAALANAARGVSLLEGLVEQDPSSASAKGRLGEGYRAYGDVFFGNRQWDQAQDAYQKALAALEAQLAVDRGNADAKRTVCDVMVKVATARERSGDRDGAILAYREAAGMADSLKSTNPHDVAAKRRFLEASVGLGRTCAALAGVAGSPMSLRAERWRESQTWYRRADAAWQELVNERALDTSVVDAADIRRGLAESEKALAVIEQRGSAPARR